MNTSARAALILVSASSLLLAAGGCDRGTKAAASAPPPPPAVSVATAVTEAVPIVMEFSGTLQASKSVDITPRVSGYVDKRLFVEGAFVTEGDPLYKIDPRPFQAHLEALQGQLAADEADEAFYKTEVARVTELYEKQAATENEVLSYNKDYAEAQGAVQTTKAQIEQAKLDLSFTDITAPFAGQIQNTLVNVGALVAEQRDVLTTLVQIDPIYVVFNISRRELYQVQELQAAGVISPGRKRESVIVKVTMPDGTPYPQDGHLDFVSAQLDPSTDTLMARAVIPNKYTREGDIRLWPGQYTPVQAILGERPDAITVPEKAIVQGHAGARVYVVGADDTVESRAVELGPQYGHKRVIEKGIEAGERVVVDGTQKVKAGIRVHVVPPGDQPKAT